MPQRDAKVFEIFVRQMSQYRGINVVLSKALGVLGQAEFFEPIRYLRRCGHCLHPGYSGLNWAFLYLWPG